MIPMLDLKAQYRALKPEIDAAVANVLDTGVYVLGPNVRAFEHESAAYLGVERAVGLASGTDALRLALDALGLARGDEVITTPFTFIATVNTISRAGAVPVFADIDPTTFNIDPADVERRITRRTRGIIAVHLYGQPADLDAIGDIAERHGLWLLEDACQALGAKWHGRAVGSFGVAGCFSFYPTKNLGAVGDAGLLCSNSTTFATRVEALGRHGGRERYKAETIGYNSRLDEIQAAILRVKLRHLDHWNTQRRRIAARYSELLRGTPVVTPEVAPEAIHVFHQYTIRAPNRDGLAATLKSDDIDTMVYYPIPIHLQPLYRGFGLSPGSLPQSERAAAEVLSLPIYPELTDEQIARVAACVRHFYEC